MDSHVRLFTAGLPLPSAPRWWYQDLQGQLQGPFDAATMSRWCAEGALPGDLRCLGVAAQDAQQNLVPSSAAHMAAFQPLQTLLEVAAAGVQYMPVRLAGVKAGADEGGAKGGSRLPGDGRQQQPGGGGGTVQASGAGGQLLGQPDRPDVQRAGDQRAGLNGLQQHLAQQQQQQPARPGTGASSQLRAGANSGGMMRGVPAQPPQPLGGAAGASAAQPGAPAAGAGADGSGGGAAAAELLHPGSELWQPMLLKLLNREGFSGKDADIKWRVILASGDRVGPFSTEQMSAWLLGGKPPKGINKAQASETAADPASLSVAGILGADYNAQRLPGAKFFKPLGSLLAAVAAGLHYEAVNKHDLVRGLPKPGWNELTGGGARGGAPPAPPQPQPQPQQQAGKAGKAGKAAAKANNNANNASNNSAAGKGGMQAGRANAAPTAPLAGKVGPARALPDGDLLAGGSSGGGGGGGTAKQSTFKHPMALRQQQRQQEALMAAAAGGAPGAPGAGLQGPLMAAGGKGGFGGPAPAGRLMGPLAAQQQAAGGVRGGAAGGMFKGPGGVAGTPMAQQQQQQQQQAAAAAAAAAFGNAAAAGRFGAPAGMAGPQQQQQQQQMLALAAAQQQQLQAAGLALMQLPQGAQAVWLKQQQLPGQPMAAPGAMFAQMPAGQPGLLGYPVAGGPGGAAMAAVPGQPPAPMMQQPQPQPQPGDAGMPRTSSSGGSAKPTQQMMHAAALLFLHDSQQPAPQPHQPQPPQPQPARWWVQQSERAFSGPYTGLQMYQAYLQPAGPLRLTDATQLSAVAAAPAPPAPGAAAVDVPPGRAFAPLGALLEAASQGFCLVPWPAAGPAREASAPAAPLVRHMGTGATAPLASVASQAALLQRAASSGGAQQGAAGEGPPGAQLAGSGSSEADGRGRQRQQQQQQVMAAAGGHPAGFIQLPNGALMQVQAPPQPGQQPPPPPPAPTAAAAVDPITVATALFTAGGLPPPHAPVWYIHTPPAAPGGGAADDAQGTTQGPLEPSVS
jgi:hypothetical protein